MAINNYKVIFTPNIDEQITAIYDYIAEVLANPTAGDKLLENINKAVKYIERDPFMYPIARNEVFRKCLIGNYIMFYEIYEKEKVVLLLSMYHGSQNYEQYY